MSTSVIMDLVIAGVLILCVILGARRGLFRSLAEVAIMIVALVLSAQAASFGASLVVEKVLRPATEEAIEQRVDEMMSEDIRSTSPLEEMERVIAAIPNAFIREQAEKLLDTLGLSADTVPGYSARDTLLALAGQVVDTVLDTMVYNLLYALLYLVCFLLLSLLLRLVVKALDLTFRLPLLHQVNRVGGALFGGAKGVLLVWLLVWLLGRWGIWVTPETVADSYLLRTAAYLSELAGCPVI